MELDRLKRRLEQMIDDLQHYLGEGGAASFDQYRQYVGRIEGVRLAIVELDDIAKQTLED